MNTQITPDVLSDEIFSLYAASGFGEVVPLAELRRGFDDILDEIGPILGELIKADRKAEDFADAVFDDEGYPNLVRVHGMLLDIFDIGVPGEFIAWVPRLRVLLDDDHACIQRLSQAFAALAFGAEDRGHRLLGRFVVFELLCVVQRAQLRGKPRRCHPEVVGLPSSFIERTAERELARLRADPELVEALRGCDDPINALAGKVHLVAAGLMEVLAEDVAFLRHEGLVDMTLRKRALEVSDHLPPDEAVLFRHATGVFDANKVSYAQLRRRHPVLLDGTTDNGLSQRTRRARERWHSLISRAWDGEDLPPHESDTLIEVLKRFDEEGEQ